MLIGIHITPDAKEESIEKASDTRYLISVREPAEDNRANKRMLEILAEIFPDSYPRIVSGHHAPSKIISLEKKS